MRHAKTVATPVPTLDSLFAHAAFGPWISQLVVAPFADFVRPTAPLSDEIDRIVENRLTAGALALAKARQVELAKTDAEYLRSADFATSIQSLKARIGGARACRELSKRGIRALVIKGPAIAEAYRSPRLRAYTDLDLLVAPREFRAALRTLVEAGWRVQETYPRRFFPRWCVEGVNLDREGIDRVDLHHHVPPWAWGRGLPFDELWQRSRDLDLEGEPVRCASVEDNLLIAALHTVSDRSRPGKTPVIWQDLVQLTRAVDTDLLIATARVAGLSGWLAAVLSALPAGSVPARLVERLGAEPPTRPRRLAALMDVAHTGRRPSREWAARLPVLSGVLYAAAVLVPGRAFLRAARADDRYLPYWRSLLRSGGAIELAGRDL